MDMPKIAAVFADRNVFMTGGTGYMGKVLIEKLLRSCPDVGNIYILMRAKYGKTLQQRLDEIIDNILFDKLKKINPEALNKIIPIEGDISLLGLGISATDRNILIETVSIVYNLAATIRFNEPLEKALTINTRGTREVCKMVLDLKEVVSFQHVSTAYCQLDKFKIEEKLYSPHANWNDLLNMIETINPLELKLITPKLAAGFPNTYTFTKSLAESVVKDLCENKVPAIIYRPTIVIPIWREPVPGWCDNINGPVGLIAGSGKGVIRTSYVNYEAKIDFMPVDIAIKGMIKATWKQIVTNDKSAIAVYNCSSNKVLNLNATTIAKVGAHVVNKAPPQMLWYPNFHKTEHKSIYLMHIYFCHLIPAILIDLLLKVLHRPPLLLKIQTKIFSALKSLEYFIRNQWDFVNDNFFDLDENLCNEDMMVFGYKLDEFDVFTFFLTACRSSIPLILKEKLNVKRNGRIMLIMGVIHYTIQSIVCFYLFRYVCNEYIIPGFEQYCLYLQRL